MPDLAEQVMAILSANRYSPVKPKALARKLGVGKGQLPQLRRALRELAKEGRIEFGHNHTIRAVAPHGTVVGVFRRTSFGGFVRPKLVDGKAGAEIRIREENALDAANGDEVLVRVLRKPARRDDNPLGEIVRIVERATRQFVGTYFERDGNGYVRVDGTVFSHSIYVGDPGAKGAKLDDKVVFEMLRFPGPDDRGEGVIAEILGPRGKPGVDTLSIIRAFALPDEFPKEVLQEAREMAALFDEKDLEGREDYTKETIVTIDPADARDFDDAISLTRDRKSGHWLLGVHIADVSRFVPAGEALDREARKRGNSVYLPQRVLPMFPEIISNGLASLQQGKVRFVKTAWIDFTPHGQQANVRFANGAIRVRRRFTYEQVSKTLNKPAAAKGLDRDVLDLLLRMKELAMILRERRHKRGSLELVMPETELELDDQGRVTGAHFVANDISHQVIEDFMLAANEAVAEHLASLNVAFLRRVHPAPEPTKLQDFAEFARLLGYSVKLEKDRFGLQRVLEESTGKPEQYAVHYALLRSLKQAVYGPGAEGHYALASEDYCHFTSPIRRYPDLTVHRLLEQWLRTGRCGSDPVELAAVGEHCSHTERRADTAERELIKAKLLAYMSERLGLEMPAIITGVADYGFFAQAEEFPVEGLVHISSLVDDYYYFDELSHTLHGRRTKRRYRLGDRVTVQVARVDVYRRQLDFRVVKVGK
ncbi:MAG TPA: ribonuclease R [Gemmataceae bacterium]|jgi:ribonuclease R|nr:ribonuclease R [Gemmataceae bacterium]